MTTVEFFRSAGRIVGFEVSGHTGFDEPGKDILCSAVSALTQTTVMGIVEHLKLDAAFSVSDGELYIMLDRYASDDDISRAEILFETLNLGLSSIANDYGEYLNIIEREV